ncbi:inositol phosphorylceramide synthase regulatory subunit Kei1p [[Candida] anglica]|uniref:Inositol phosphorylceramide synthase regulatory subunit Kei1p n=1 Tax=[Candida] anglica TaxID=148631 RepID=A0ABP0EPW8_9ASCO
MSLSQSLVPFLPSKFVGYLPLYIGVELILGIAILNKVSGAYGIVSIFTGHPINFWQWLYNMLAIIVLPIYISALSHLQTRPSNVRKVSLACLIFVADTIIGVFYTIYFVSFWFSHEDNVPAEESVQPLTSQSASEARELFVTSSTTLIITFIRFYFTLVIISFTRALLKQNASQRLVAEDEEEAINQPGKLAKMKKFILGWEIRATEYLGDLFR